MLRFAILGFGNRGRLFAGFVLKDPNAELVAVVDNAESARKAAKELFGVDEKDIYSSADEFYAKGKIADAILLCTQDADHYDMATKAMALGYDLCLEKPAAITEEDCLLRFVNNQLRAEVEIFNWMLPNKGVVSTLVFNNAGKPLVFDFFFGNSFLNVNYSIAKRASEFRCVLVRRKCARTRRAGKFHKGCHALSCVDFFMTYRAKRIFTLALIKDNGIPTMRTDL